MKILAVVITLVLALAFCASAGIEETNPALEALTEAEGLGAINASTGDFASEETNPALEALAEAEGLNSEPVNDKSDEVSAWDESLKEQASIDLWLAIRNYAEANNLSYDWGAKAYEQMTGHIAPTLRINRD